jgi:hypothetical protein
MLVVAHFGRVSEGNSHQESHNDVIMYLVTVCFQLLIPLLFILTDTSRTLTMKSKWRMPSASRIKPILLQLIYKAEEKILGFLGTWRGLNSIILVCVYFSSSFSKLIRNKIANMALLP